MTTRRLLILSHLLVAFVATGIAGLTAAGSYMLLYLVVGTTLLSIAAGWWCAARIRLGLRLIENAIAKGERLEGVSEFHKSAAILQAHVQRWVDSAAMGQRQTREVEAVLASVDRQGTAHGERHNAARQLRMVLASLGREAHETLKQLITCNGEIDRIGQKLSKGAQQQSDTAVKATRDIERLSEDIGTIETTASRTQQAVKSAQETAASASEVVLQLVQGMECIREEVTVGEAKVRLLREHALEIGALAHTIADVCARTDMLALNASIESVRAGEHGRGFAVVADEIRKLAGQIANSTQEVLDRITSIETEMDEANKIMSNERADIDAESERVESVGDFLAAIQNSTAQMQENLEKVGQASQNQLRRTSDIVTFLEHVLEVSDAGRSNSEETRWKTKSLTELIVRLTDVLEPLLLSAQNQPTTNISSSAASGTFARSGESSDQPAAKLAQNRKELVVG